MRAVIYDAFGPAREVLKHVESEDIPPGPGEVRVALEVSGVNPSDVKARAGARPGVTKPPYAQIIPHSDGAGVIAEVGAGVDPSRQGDRVWIWNGQWRRAFGTAASHITLPAEQAVTMPDIVSMETGATLGIPGLTAAHTVFADGPIANKSVLIQGAGGTVGYLATQLAKWGGARVIATARDQDADRVRQAGADAVVDFTRPDIASAIRAANGGEPVDRIVEVEFGINAQTDTDVIAENGVICAYGSALTMEPVLPFYPLMFKAITLQMVLIYLLTPLQRQTAITRLHDALTEGALSCPVEAVFDLADVAAAHEAVEAGARAGAVLVRTRD